MSSSALGAHLLRQIELYLTAVGLLIILLVPSFFAAEQRVTAIAITAVGVGVVHGLLFWLVRRRQRLVREALIHDVQGMLMDRINNKLQVVMVAAVSPDGELSPEDHARLREIAESVKEVTVLLDRLSLDSLSEWQTRYKFKPSGP